MDQGVQTPNRTSSGMLCEVDGLFNRPARTSRTRFSIRPGLVRAAAPDGLSRCDGAGLLFAEPRDGHLPGRVRVPTGSQPGGKIRLDISHKRTHTSQFRASANLKCLGYNRSW